MAKEGDTTDRPAPGRQSSQTLSKISLTGRGGVVRLAGGPIGRHPTVGTAPWLDDVDVQTNGQGTHCPVGNLPAQPKVTHKGKAR